MMTVNYVNIAWSAAAISSAILNIPGNLVSRPDFAEKSGGQRAKLLR